MSGPEPRLEGLGAPHLRVRSAKIFLDSLEVETDIGFHDFEIGAPQRLLVTVEIWLEDSSPPRDDDPHQAWDYDVLRSEIQAIAAARRYNLQETLAHAIFHRLSELHGVRDLRVRTCKPDVYPQTKGVGVEIASFSQPGAPT